MTNKEHMQRYSASEILERQAKGESLTDFERVRNKSEAELDQDIATDPDWKDIPADWYLDAEKVVPRGKRLLSLRLDADLVDWFREQGRGYQTRINQVLRAYMDHASKKRTG